MPDLTERLEREHGAMRKILDLLEGEVAAFEAGSAMDAELVGEILDYTLAYPERVHHPIEDRLYQLLADRAPRLDSALGGILEEHERLSRSLAAVNEQFQLWKNDAEVPRSHFAKAALDYLQLSRAHMEREERELFPRARETLTEGDWESLKTEGEIADALGESPESEHFARLRRRILAPPSAN